MIDINYKPVLKRETEILPAMDEKKQMSLIVLRDKEGITNKNLAMPAELLLILQMFDGSNSIKEIQSNIMKQTNVLLPESELIHLAEELDNALFLENEKTAAVRISLIDDFKKATTRKPCHCGISYPDNTLELTSFISGLYKIEKDISITPNTLSGAISPHIDFRRGGRVYSSTYSKLHQLSKPDTIIALGTSHRGGNSPFIMTRKNYETPYGEIETDKDLYQKFKDILWYEPDEEEYYHKNEHSLEFQAIWIKYIWRENTPKWLPVLTSRFERFATDITPSKIDSIEKMFKSIERLVSEISKDKKILIIAGADLSHVGPRFGDDINITPQLKSDIEKKDREKIEYILKLDYDGFYSAVMKDKNSTRICGLSPIYSSLRLVKAIKPESKPELLDYAQADDPFGGFVSFASIVF
ncbi:MAG: AmmeMemoRadiSam system protein B [Elusimicrobiales bacterium]|nr:AmmeMemoRadiSam system protein B [Elusimicrobiales bacterium]